MASAPTTAPRSREAERGRIDRARQPQRGLSREELGRRIDLLVRANPDRGAVFEGLQRMYLDGQLDASDIAAAEEMLRDSGTAGAAQGQAGRSAQAAEGTTAAAGGGTAAGTPGEAGGGGTTTVSPFQQAKERHRRNVQVLDGLIQRGRAEQPTGRWGPEWPNACRWLAGGRTRLYALTQTHDSPERATALGVPGNSALFGIDQPVPAVSDYNENDRTDRRNIYSQAQPSWLGFRQSGNPSLIAIIEPADKSEDSVKSTLVHEVQHDADHHEGGAWGSYQTEFRAYWLDGNMAYHSDASGSANPAVTTADGVRLEGFDNARQQHIFQHLYDSSAYPYVKQSWGSDATFRRNVQNLRRPEGVNFVNSPEVDDLYLELQKDKPDRTRVEQLAGRLSASDREAIRGPAMRTRWEQMLAARYSGERLAQIRQRLGLDPAPGTSGPGAGQPAAGATPAPAGATGTAT